MMEEFDNSKNLKKNDVFSKSVRAGRRTYFFDVKSTKRNEYYLTITESKKRYDEESGKSFFEKHKIFLYQEDFDNFLESFNEVVSYIKENQPEIIPREEYNPDNESKTE